jgi:hypothetical protein
VAVLALHVDDTADDHDDVADDLEQQFRDALYPRIATG